MASPCPGHLTDVQKETTEVKQSMTQQHLRISSLTEAFSADAHTAYSARDTFFNVPTFLTLSGHKGVILVFNIAMVTVG